MALTRITKGVIKPNENYQAGIVTATGLDVNGNGDISGDLNVGGILTYEDVTSIDSVGIITAQKGIHVGAGVSAVGVGTFGSLDISGDIDVDGHTNLDNVSIAGVTTASDNVIIPDNKKLVLGTQTGRQLQLYHNTTGSSNHVIESTSSSNHLIFKATTINPRANTFSFRNHAHNKNVFRVLADTSTTLYYNGNTKLTTENTGVNITGIVTATSADINGDLDVDGHTNLDNVSVAGVSTFSGNADFSSGVDVTGTITGNNLTLSDNDPELTFTDLNNNPDYRIKAESGNLSFEDTTNGNVARLRINADGHVDVIGNLDVGAGIDVTGNIDSTVAGGNNQLKIETTSSGDPSIYFAASGSGGHNIEYIRSSNTLNFKQAGGQVRLSITAAGHLLPGTDSQYNIGSNSVRFANAYVDTYYGDGSNLTGITGTTISGNANNRIITGSGTANTLNAESTFTYDGDGLLSMTSTSGAAEFTIVGPNNTDSGIYFNDGSNDGALIYDHSSRQLKFRAGGHTRMYFAGGNDNNNNVIYLVNNSYDDGILQYYNGGLYLKTGSSSGDRIISFNTAGSERLRITSAGDVGIGYNSPTVKLHVREAASGASSYDNRYHIIVEDDAEAYLGFYVPSSGYAGVRFTDNTGLEGYIDYYFGTDEMVYSSTSAHYWKTAGSERLRITSDKVMFSVDAKVDSNNQRDLGTSGNRWKSLFLGTQLEIDAASSTEMIRLDVAGTNFARIGHNTASGTAILDVRSEGHTRFLTNGNNERLRITSGGKIGMGAQTNPQGNLDIRTTDEDDAIRLVNTSTGNNGIQWWNEYGGLTKRVSMDYGEGDANFDIACFRADSQDNRPYGNVRILTGSYSSPTTNFRVTTLGSVHMPNQPSFSAADTAGHVYGSSSTPTMVFNNADFNVGNNYDTSNGIFTAPIAGKYQFSFCGMAAGGPGDFQVRITKNGGGYFNNNGSGRGYGTFEPYGFTVLMDLAINDEVQIKIYSSNTSAYIYAGQTWNRFSGYLIG